MTGQEYVNLQSLTLLLQAENIIRGVHHPEYKQEIKAILKQLMQLNDKLSQLTKIDS